MEESVNPIPEHPYLARGREFLFGGVTLVLGVLLCNFVLYGGVHLAFGITGAALTGCAWCYARKCGHRFGWYEKCLLLLSLVIFLGFGRSDDGTVKFFMLLFLFFAVNLSLCIAAGQNRRSPQGAMSLLDAPRAFFRLGVGRMGRAGSGIAQGFRQGGTATRRIGAVGTGLLVSLPILAVMIVLLMSADAAFEGLIDLLPEFDLEEVLNSVLFGLLLAWVLYSRGLSLDRNGRPDAARTDRRGINALTVNTVLIMVCLTYVVYLLSQLAYFSGGLSGILPEGFTLAEYARRGFFEMAWLCAMNLGLLCGCVWLIREETLPRMTRIAGSFLSAITIFLILTASAKMLLYIGSYGLTRRRVLTEVIMLWLALTTILVTVRLFRPGFGCMKAVVLAAMVLGALVFWTDVNTVVASYNVRAYQSGKLETVDVDHIGTLGTAGTPWLLELAEEDDPEVAAAARTILNRHSTRYNYHIDDFRGWNYPRARADRLLKGFIDGQDRTLLAEIRDLLGVDAASGSIQRSWSSVPTWQQGKRMISIRFPMDDREAFAGQLAEAGWEAAPISPQMLAALNKDVSLFQEFRNVYMNNAWKDGYWLFRDLHPDARETDVPADVLLRAEYDFLLAYYDNASGFFYVFQVKGPA